ncbi:NAD(P)-binding protein [Fomes fomentarius]|nr:NAD(P)-binding protein [Fomes fomentarius]
MPSYVVTGASRGLGFEFVRQLSQDKANAVFAAVRNPQGASKLNELAKSSSNVHIVKADLSDVGSIKAAAAEVAKVTGGSLDYLINNAVFVDGEHAKSQITEFPDEKTLEDQLVLSFRTNVAGVAHMINAFLPLLRAGSVKKVITLSTGLADPDFVRGTGFTNNPQYAIAKGALNVLVAEYATALADEGFVFLAISPGVVNTAEKPPTPEDVEGFLRMVEKFKRLYPAWEGVPLTPETSVRLVREVIDKVGPKESGAFVSHFGSQQWL